MLKVELFPDLTHCIETVARREHTAVYKQVLKPGQSDRYLVEKLEILRLFLVRTDFKKLRAESEKQLTEGKIVRFVVYLEEDIPKYEMHIITSKY